jgi:hypothetical protein
MGVFEIVVAMLLGGAALAAVARRFGAPYPALVALAGAALALVPGVPTLVLDPERTLALFVAPVLVDAAFDASPRDLRANWRAVASLALGAIVAPPGVRSHFNVPSKKVKFIYETGAFRRLKRGVINRKSPLITGFFYGNLQLPGLANCQYLNRETAITRQENIRPGLVLRRNHNLPTLILIKRRIRKFCENHILPR